MNFIKMHIFLNQKQWLRPRNLANIFFGCFGDVLKSEKQELEQWLTALTEDQFLTSIVGSSEVPVIPAPGYLVPLAFLGTRIHVHPSTYKYT